MSSIPWPSSLPCALSGTLKNNASDPWVSDKAETGPSRRRARFTRSLGRFDFMLSLSLDQMNELATFYEVTLTNGLQAFSWTHPTRKKTYVVQFSARFEELFQVHGRYHVSISLEET